MAGGSTKHINMVYLVYAMLIAVLGILDHSIGNDWVPTVSVLFLGTLTN